MTGARQWVASIHVVSHTYGKIRKGSWTPPASLRASWERARETRVGPGPAAPQVSSLIKCVCENICYTPVSGML